MGVELRELRSNEAILKYTKEGKKWMIQFSTKYRKSI